MAVINYGPISWERIIGAVEDVQRRLERAVSALEHAELPYAVIGENAVAAWVSKVDRAAVRTTVAIDLLVLRPDFEVVREALESAGFVWGNSPDEMLFVDGFDGRPREGVRLTFANEGCQDAARFSPAIENRVRFERFDVIELDSLVLMELAFFRTRNRMHLRDLLNVGLVDESWIAKLPVELGQRLQLLIDTPEG